MKTAISLPDDLFEAAEDLARELGVSRSQLYARAVAEYVARRRDEEVTAKLNEIYARVEARVDPILDELQRRSVHARRWRRARMRAARRFREPTAQGGCQDATLHR